MKNIRILHLLSNWKWTAVSEPAVDLALAQMHMGARVSFCCGRSPGGQNDDVAYYARRKGLTPVHVLEMPKHLHVFAALRDYSRLKKIVKEFAPDIIHCHMRNAHLMAALIRKFSTRSLIVNSIYNPDGPRNDLRSRFLFRFCNDGLIVINEKSRTKALAESGFSAGSVQIAEPAVDLDRFSPDRRISENMNSFGLPPDAFVIGMVTRIRDTRRIDLPLAAVHALADQFPQLRLLIVGRGRKGAVASVVAKPAGEMGILNRVILPGYCDGDRLVAAYRAMDVMAYPIPGSDKSCRTVREAMAAGLPVIAPGIGFLPKLIEDNVTGRIMDFNSESLAKILQELVLDETKLRELGQRALETARQRFSAKLQAQRTLEFYDELLRQTISGP
jgi:glycosyltransferase involved in cell wall biosynthesis